ncbi:hypothetical protein C8J56DRAFT_960291 [Mycena floridula]|nr:hypothetical protein C8J56DRAFT_960291 [Mycena floridula]
MMLFSPASARKIARHLTPSIRYFSPTRILCRCLSENLPRQSSPFTIASDLQHPESSPPYSVEPENDTVKPVLIEKPRRAWQIFEVPQKVSLSEILWLPVVRVAAVKRIVRTEKGVMITFYHPTYLGQTMEICGTQYHVRPSQDGSSTPASVVAALAARGASRHLTVFLPARKKPKKMVAEIEESHNVSVAEFSKNGRAVVITFLDILDAVKVAFFLGEKCRFQMDGCDERALLVANDVTLGDLQKQDDWTWHPRDVGILSRPFTSLLSLDNELQSHRPPFIQEIYHHDEQKTTPILTFKDLYDAQIFLRNPIAKEIKASLLPGYSCQKTRVDKMRARFLPSLSHAIACGATRTICLTRPPSDKCFSFANLYPRLRSFGEVLVFETTSNSAKATFASVTVASAVIDFFFNPSLYPLWVFTAHKPMEIPQRHGGVLSKREKRQDFHQKFAGCSISYLPESSNNKVKTEIIPEIYPR